MDRSTTINGVKFSDEQIITLQNIDYFADKHNQDKISFAIAELEKVKEEIDKRPVSIRNYGNGEFDEIILDDVYDVIDNQIASLKKGVE